MSMTTMPSVSSRAATLEDLLGSLDDPANPVGRDALLTADEHWELVLDRKSVV